MSNYIKIKSLKRNLTKLDSISLEDLLLYEYDIILLKNPLLIDY